MIRNASVWSTCTVITLMFLANTRAGTTNPSTQPKIEESILKPAVGLFPKINSASVYGQHPNRPFLYSIPATGERPMTYTASGLPKGLKLDIHNGRISGSVAAAGEYIVTFYVSNALGSTQRKWKLIIGDKIALTPPMGWNSWNCWADAVDQKKVMQSARAMVLSGLADHGWNYINIDDTWQGKRDGKTHALQPDQVKFPDMKSLCDQIHGLGLKAGIYSTPWVRSYGNRMGGSSENPQGDYQDFPGKQPRNKKVLPFAVGRYSFAEQDAQQWANWGIDYLKYDWNPIELPQVREMADALNKTGRDIVYSLSNQASLEVAAGLPSLANSWRTTDDIRDRWSVLHRIGFSEDKWAAFTGPGHYCDPDMLVVGYVGWGPKLHLTQLTPDEQYTHVALWSLLSAPLLLGCDLDRLDPFTLGLLTNDEVLAIDQDALCEQAVSMALSEHVLVYVKNLEDGSKAIGIFNVGNQPEIARVDFTALHIAGPLLIRDLWRQKDLGLMKDHFESTIPRHGVAMLKCSASNVGEISH